MPDGSEFWQEDELVELSGYELSDYAAAISEQIEQEAESKEGVFHKTYFFPDEMEIYHYCTFHGSINVTEVGRVGRVL